MKLSIEKKVLDVFHTYLSTKTPIYYVRDIHTISTPLLYNELSYMEKCLKVGSLPISGLSFSSSELHQLAFDIEELIASNLIEALTSPVKWIREWGRGFPIINICA